MDTPWQAYQSVSMDPAADAAEQAAANESAAGEAAALRREGNRHLIRGAALAAAAICFQWFLYATLRAVVVVAVGAFLGAAHSTILGIAEHRRARAIRRPGPVAAVAIAAIGVPLGIWEIAQESGGGERNTGILVLVVTAGALWLFWPRRY